MWRNWAASLSTALLAHSDHYLWMLTLLMPFGLARLLTGVHELTSKHTCTRKPAVNPRDLRAALLIMAPNWKNSSVPRERTVIKLWLIHRVKTYKGHTGQPEWHLITWVCLPSMVTGDRNENQEYVLDGWSCFYKWMKSNQPRIMKLH